MLYTSFDPSDLRQKYWADAKSLVEIAKDYQVSTATIARAMRHYEIPMRPAKPRGGNRETGKLKTVEARALVERVLVGKETLAAVTEDWNGKNPDRAISRQALHQRVQKARKAKLGAT